MLKPRCRRQNQGSSFFFPLQKGYKRIWSSRIVHIVLLLYTTVNLTVVRTNEDWLLGSKLSRPTQGTDVLGIERKVISRSVNLYVGGDSSLEPSSSFPTASVRELTGTLTGTQLTEPCCTEHDTAVETSFAVYLTCPRRRRCHMSERTHPRLLSGLLVCTVPIEARRLPFRAAKACEPPYCTYHFPHSWITSDLPAPRTMWLPLTSLPVVSLLFWRFVAIAWQIEKPVKLQHLS